MQAAHQDGRIALAHAQQGRHDELEEDQARYDLVDDLGPHLQQRLASGDARTAHHALQTPQAGGRMLHAAAGR